MEVYSKDNILLELKIIDLVYFIFLSYFIFILYLFSYFGLKVRIIAWCHTYHYHCYIITWYKEKIQKILKE